MKEGEGIINKSRFLLTDVLPYEVPLIFSNNNLYLYLQELDDEKLKKWEECSINILVDNKKIKDTEPFNFLIYKNENSTRMISLIHPVAQLYMLKFIEKYDLEIINFFKQNAVFSLRYPLRVSRKKIEANDSISKSMLALLDADSHESASLPTSYFVKRKFTRINDFFNSPLLNNLEIKYSKLFKTDFQSCFYNIYTHSLDWSYLGDIKLAKESRNDVRFSSILDKLLQASNYGETNGIVVGPEFSRYIAEIVLCNIDNIVYRELKERKIIYKVDYEIVRFMDDIFVFCNEDGIAKEIKKVIEETGFRYKLSLNESKSVLECRPFLKMNFWESKIRSKLVSFYDSLVNYEKLTHKHINVKIKELSDEIKLLLIDYNSERTKIIGYVLRFFENQINSIIDKINEKESSIRLYVIFKLIDLFQYILIFAINSSNIVKYIKLTLFLFLNEKKRNIDITDLLYKKSLEILKYHSEKRTEVLNLFISLKFFSKDLPEGLLVKFLEEKKDYFTMSSIAFYVNSKERRYKYKKVRKIINVTIADTVQNFLDKYPNISNHDIEKIILSKEFYLLYDFYTCDVLYKETRSKIGQIKEKVDETRINWEEKTLNKFFIDFIKGFDKPFMNWNKDIKSLVETLESKSARTDTSNSG
ncbi:RNA-directed DNA polymerase [Bacillus wiedmannii]|uniref:RNA-directed DNA polymerase n=1 Tax=Bacillus wiedmannii TaxID=1890302 RepID=UPI003D047EF2